MYAYESKAFPESNKNTLTVDRVMTLGERLLGLKFVTSPPPPHGHSYIAKKNS